jgi:hypothetical protein
MSLLRPSNAAPAAAPATRPRTIRKTTGLFCLRKPTQFSLGVVYTGTNFAGIDVERVATPTARAVLAHRVDASRTSLASVLALLEQRKSIQTLRLPISSSVNSRRASLPNRPREPAPRPPCRHFKIQPCSCLSEGSKKSSSGVRCSTLQQVAHPHAPSTHTQHLCGHVYHLPLVPNERAHPPTQREGVLTHHVEDTTRRNHETETPPLLSDVRHARALSPDKGMANASQGTGYKGRAPKPAADLVQYLEEAVSLLADAEGPADAEGRSLLVANVLTELEGACPSLLALPSRPH